MSWWTAPNGTRLKVAIETAQSLFPLLLDLPQNMVASIVNTQIMNPKKFLLTYPLASVAADAAQFEAAFRGDLMCRGPMWPIVNWIVMEGTTR